MISLPLRFPLDGTKFHLDGPKALPLESARTRRALDPLFDAAVSPVPHA